MANVSTPFAPVGHQTPPSRLRAHTPITIVRSTAGEQPPPGGDLKPPNMLVDRRPTRSEAMPG
ncbi:hypothetical protein [Streptomyces spongiae]|uniref:Uncharacterized protein n=1 Tax=Streptomyces spongiae TaxID=565072 RepID=A0A5N8XD12_9ACTN|nr:hypothetical protein [Streptomyces spongiae]MPY57339.1 hypothetical protein [Streptomyces spongiae]